jgi:hypothetical protein
LGHVSPLTGIATAGHMKLISANAEEL